MADVPADYLLNLFRQDWIRKWPDLYDYLVVTQERLIKEEGIDQAEHGRGFESLDEYMEHGRG